MYAIVFNFNQDVEELNLVVIVSEFYLHVSTALNRVILIINFVTRFQSFIPHMFGRKKYSASLKKLLQQGIADPEIYDGLVYRFRKTAGKSNCSEQIGKLINRYKRIGYNLALMRQTACIVVNPIMVDS